MIAKNGSKVGLNWRLNIKRISQFNLSLRIFLLFLHLTGIFVFLSLRPPYGNAFTCTIHLELKMRLRIDTMKDCHKIIKTQFWEISRHRHRQRKLWILFLYTLCISYIIDWNPPLTVLIIFIVFTITCLLKFVLKSNLNFR